MSKSAAINTIIGTISHSETVLDGGTPKTTVIIPHKFWTGRKPVTTDYRFTFHKVSENYQFAYQEGVLVKVDFKILRKKGEYEYNLEPVSLRALGQAFEGYTSSFAINRISGPIIGTKEKQHKGAPFFQISVPLEYDKGNESETTWLNFTYWDVSEKQKFLYNKYNSVTIDYNLFNKGNKYDIRQNGHINLHTIMKKKETA